jgi:hypothetical protein
VKRSSISSTSHSCPECIAEEEHAAISKRRSHTVVDAYALVEDNKGSMHFERQAQLLLCHWRSVGEKHGITGRELYNSLTHFNGFRLGKGLYVLNSGESEKVLDALDTTGEWLLVSQSPVSALPELPSWFDEWINATRHEREIRCRFLSTPWERM